MTVARVLSAEDVTGQRVPVKVWTDEIETAAATQLRNTASLPFVFHHVAAMADVHLGIGATVGSVVATKGAICPAAVGVDIGCGMSAALTTIPASALDGKLPELRHSIERAVPVGFEQHRTPLDEARGFVYRQIGGPTPTVATEKMLAKGEHQLGTLGGGNHFIEICTYAGADTAAKEPLLAILLHSGSRGIGNKVAQAHIDKAKGIMKRMFIELPDPDLAFFAQGTEEFKAYIVDLTWCQEYAAENRRMMMQQVKRALGYAVGESSGLTGDGEIPVAQEISCHHNYVAWEHHYGENVMVTRKGAIRARKGDWGIIPGSMGTGSFIVQGLGNAESFDSAPHGAGRRMSRTAARKTFTVEQLGEQTTGIECRKDAGVLDEIPGAYKDVGDVIRRSEDLVEVVAQLKQIIVVKG